MAHQLGRHAPFTAVGALSGVPTIPIAVFLFLAVWLPCCTSDIVFPLLFAEKMTGRSRTVSADSPRSDG